jgi:hypothetical protein
MRCWTRIHRGLWAHWLNPIPVWCKQQFVRQSIHIVASSVAWVGQNDDIRFPPQDASAQLSVATSLFLWVDRSSYRWAQGIHLGALTWTNPETRCQCAHSKIIICWGLEFVRSLLPQFDWLLWHYRDFVSWNIHHWVQFFHVTLGKGWIL